LAVVGLAAPAVEMALVRGEIDSGGIENGLRERLEIRLHGEQLAAHAADGWVGFARFDQPAEEVAREAGIGIEREDPSGF
jgi:hypothetical protein